MDDENWDDITGPGQPWGDGLTGTAGPGEDRGRDSGRSDVAGLDQLWDIGRTSGYGQAPDAAGQRTRDLGSAGDAGPAGSPGPARDSGPVRDGGPAREDGRSPEHGHSREKGSAWEGSAWESRPAREAGSSRDTTPESASAVSRDLPEDRAPNPLGAPGDRETADFLAAPPPTSSILTTAPRQEARTARPANVGDQGIAAELAGWAAGELPGQASARLAAWAAIGGSSPRGTAAATAPTQAPRAWPPSGSAKTGGAAARRSRRQARLGRRLASPRFAAGAHGGRAAQGA